MTKDDYSQYRLQDFLDDASFREWVYSPTAQTIEKWRCIYETHPQPNEITLAKSILIGIVDINVSDDEAFRIKLLQSMRVEKRARRIKKSLALSFSIAASIAIIVGLFFWTKGATSHDLLVSTGFGEWKEIILPDSSIVHLNANSSISYDSIWKPESLRSVQLVGEAFFDVRKRLESTSKFQVESNGLIVEVLGTKFNVHSRGDATEVFLEEGSIRLDWNESDELIVPGELISFDSKRKEITHRSRPAPQKHTSWKDGTLLMEDTPIIVILEKLEEIYGLKMRLDDPSALQDVKTIAVPMDALNIAIPILERTLLMKITRKEDTLIFHQ